MAQQQNAVSSRQFRLSLNDWWKGLIMAVLTPVFAIIMDSLNQGTLTFNWKIIVGAALSGLLAYLAKNFFDKPKVVILNPTDAQVEMVKEGDAKVTVTKN